MNPFKKETKIAQPDHTTLQKHEYKMVNDDLESARTFDSLVETALSSIRAAVDAEVTTDDTTTADSIHIQHEEARVTRDGIMISYDAIVSSSLNDPGARVRITSPDFDVELHRYEDMNNGNAWATATAYQPGPDGTKEVAWSTHVSGPYDAYAYLTAKQRDNQLGGDNATSSEQLEAATLKIDDVLQQLELAA